MSVYFRANIDDTDVWNPSSQTAQVLLSQLDLVATIVGIPTGLSPIVSDEVTIDAGAFSKFAEAFAARMSQSAESTAYHALFVGSFSVVLGLQLALGNQIPIGPPWLDLCAMNGRRWVLG